MEEGMRGGSSTVGDLGYVIVLRVGLSGHGVLIPFTFSFGNRLS